MISDSVPLMTAIDLLILAVTVYGIWRYRLISPGKRFERPRIGLLLSNSGLLAIALFYAADLAIMHVLPMVTARDEAMNAMEALHRNLSWLVILFAVISISIGFIELLVELQRREARVRRLVDANMIGIIISDIEGQIIEANDAFLHMVGYDREDLVSARIHMTDLTPTEWRARDARTVAELKATGTVQPFEKECFRKDGSRVPVLIGSAAFDEQRDQGVAFVLDLTERKRAEAEARESERRYRETLMELAHANRVATTGQLTASITHEVKQPITAAVTYALAARRWLSAEPPNFHEVDDALSLIVKEGNRAGEVVGRIRALIKKAPARKDAVAIDDAILEVIALTRAEAANNSVSVRTQLAEGLPRVQGDRVQLQQVLLNLIINANRMACQSRCEIQVQASHRRLLSACSRLSTPRNRAVWGLGCRSAGQLPKRITDDYGRARTCPAAPAFNSPCRRSQTLRRDAALVSRPKEQATRPRVLLWVKLRRRNS